MAGPVLGYAVRRIGDFLIEEIMFLRDVDKDVRRLQDELRRMECFLEDADTQRNSGARVNNWVKDVRKVAYDAVDLVELFALEQKNRRGRRTFKGRFICCICFACRILGRHNFGRKIQLLVERIDDIGKSRATYGIANLSPAEGAQRYVDEEIVMRRRVVLHADDSGVVVMEDQRNSIMPLLLAGEKGAQRCVTSIVGMGGLGKTTLAKKIFNDSSIKSSFDVAVWIDVSQQYRGEELLKNLYRKITGRKREEMEKMSEEEVGESLYRSLEGKKYLIVMDDVWDTEVWKIIENHLPEARGRRVLITARSYDVIPPANLLAEHSLRFLNKDESWELFLRKAYPNKDGREACQGEFEKRGREIVEGCGGLPLALIVVGGLLSSKKKLKEWDEIAKTIVWLHEREGQQCMKILALSYADLPEHLKWCFLYFGMFPEDFEIDVKKLIRLWIAEGLVQLVEGKEDITLEELAMQYLENLVLRCLVQVDDELVDDIKRCRIHDLLHELAIKESKELDFFHCQQKTPINHPTTDYSSVRRLCLDYSSRQLLSERRSTPRLRTLLCFKFQTDYGFPKWRMRLIRVLEFGGAPIRAVPDQIGELANLRYLGLQGTRILSLPASIRNLSRLQSLDIRDTPLVEINSGVWKIEAIRQVLVSDYMEMNGIQGGSLKNLQVFEETRAGDWMNNCLSRLTSLRTLRLMRIDKIHHQELSVALAELSNLSVLELSGKSVPTVSLKLSNLEDLHWLSLRGRIHCPRPFECQWPSRLSILKLENTLLDQDPLPSLGSLTDLRVLDLQWNSYCGKEMICPRESFPRLQRFRVYDLQELEKWIVEDPAMPRLTTLMVSGCPKLMELPQGLKNLTSLEILTLLDVSASVKARVDMKNGEDWKNIKHIPSIFMEDVLIIKEQSIQESTSTKVSSSDRLGTTTRA